eukprot:TRINITY_DN6307_c2_g1_i1.p1 TRINITY_DN6307_c2_g1~~TRINITY_DN6307_c2_g1_i1.p1  ORF type:complete len:827 (-),score=148.91 TRINITY_DN6307_c2_g1_i1:26-2506(-)
MFVSRFRCARAVAAAAAAAAAASCEDGSQQEMVFCDTWQEEEGVAYEETLGDDEREQDEEEEPDQQDEEENEELDEEDTLLLSARSHAQQHSLPLPGSPYTRPRPQSAGKSYHRRQLSPEQELGCRSKEGHSCHSCRRCTSRHKMSAARIGPQPPPHRPLDLNRPLPQPVPSTPSAPSRPSRFSSPSPKPRAQPASDASPAGGQQPETTCGRPQSASKTAPDRSFSRCRGQVSARDRSKSPPRGRPPPCECMAGPLAEFSERLHSFLLTFMGFHHPHKDRLRAAVDQQVEALGSGLTTMLFAQKAFQGLRSSAREGALWKKLRDYRQKLLEARCQLQEAQDLASKEAALRRHTQNASLFAQERRADAQAAAVRVLCRRPRGSEMQLLRCLAAWQRCAASKSSARKSATRSVFTAQASEETSRLRAIFAKWQQVAMASTQRREIAAASDTASKAVTQLIDNAKAATVAAVLASGLHSDYSCYTRCFMVWSRAVVISRYQNLHNSGPTSRQQVAEQADNLLQFTKHLGQRPRSKAAPGTFCQQAVFMSWAREADRKARRRHIREATYGVATRAAQLLHDRITSNLLRACISGWARVDRMTSDWNARISAFASKDQAAAATAAAAAVAAAFLQTEHQHGQCPNLLAQAPSADSRMPQTSASLRLHEERNAMPCGTTLRTFVQEEGHQANAKTPTVFADCTNDPATHHSVRPRIAKEVPLFRPDARVGVPSFHEPGEGLRASDPKDHLCFASQETMPPPWQDTHVDISSLHEFGGGLRPSDAVQHYCLASQASQSEDGYLELLEYHRQRAREARARQCRIGARNFGQARQ